MPGREVSLRTIVWLIVAAAVGSLVVIGISIAKTAASENTVKYANWEQLNNTVENTRVAVDSPISAANVAGLGIAWTAPTNAIAGWGAITGGFTVSDDTVFVQDAFSNVTAYDIRTGEQAWQTVFDSVNQGPNGVSVGDGRVYGAVNEYAFALDQKTGKLLWKSQTLPRNSNEGVDMTPLVANGTVYVSTVPGNTQGYYAGNQVGVVWALDAATGKTKWKFFTVPESLWGNPSVNSGGGLWYPPAADAEGNVYLGVANPAPFTGLPGDPFAVKSRPGNNLYTDSIVKLDGKTGKVIWYYQLTPHDVNDWDLHNSPMLAKVNGKEVVLAGAKAGIAFALDASSGKLLWKTPVGTHNGHDDDGLNALKGDFTAISPNWQDPAGYVVLPGSLGGIETPMAYADGVMYVPYINFPRAAIAESKATGTAKGPTPNGGFAAIDAATGKILWDTTLKIPPYSMATVVNDVVLTATFEGTLLALSRSSGAVLAQIPMPAGTNTGIAVSGDTVITGAAFPTSVSQRPQIVAYRLGGLAEAIPPGVGLPPAGSTPDDGETLFQQRCGTCHVFNAAGSLGRVGPNLDAVDPTGAAVKAQVTNGGGLMPSFGNVLNSQQIGAIADFVSKNANPKYGDVQGNPS